MIAAQLGLFDVPAITTFGPGMDPETGFPVGADAQSIAALTSGVGTTTCQWCGWDVVNPKFCYSYCFDYTKQPDADYPIGSSHRAVYRPDSSARPTHFKVQERLPPAYPGDIRCFLETTLLESPVRPYRDWFGTNDSSGIELWPHEYSCSRPDKWAEYKAERRSATQRRERSWFLEKRTEYASCGLCNTNTRRYNCLCGASPTSEKFVLRFLDHGPLPIDGEVCDVSGKLVYLIRNFGHHGRWYDGVLFLESGFRAKKRFVAVASVRVELQSSTEVAVTFRKVVKLPRMQQSIDLVRTYLRRVAETEFDAANHEYWQRLEAA